MRILKTAALALALAAPGMAMAATDGTPGATSTGSFVTSVQIVPPTGTTVQVIGLEDFDFGVINTSSTAATAGPSLEQFFCLNRSDAGQVNAYFQQTGHTPGQILTLNGPIANIPVNFILSRPDGGPLFGFETSHYIINTVQSDPNCTMSSVGGTAHKLSIQMGTLPSNATQALAGNYSGTFTILLSVP